MATGERISKVTLRRTARAYRPDGPLPTGMALYQWQMRRYELHVPGDPIRVEAYLRDAGFEAFSAAPFRALPLFGAIAVDIRRTGRVERRRRDSTERR